MIFYIVDQLRSAITFCLLNRFLKFRMFWKAMGLNRPFLPPKSHRIRLRCSPVHIFREDFEKSRSGDSNHPTVIVPQQFSSASRRDFVVFKKYKNPVSGGDLFLSKIQILLQTFNAKTKKAIIFQYFAGSYHF